jgi:hypothetical protein
MMPTPHPLLPPGRCGPLSPGRPPSPTTRRRPPLVHPIPPPLPTSLTHPLLPHTHRQLVRATKAVAKVWKGEFGGVQERAGSTKAQGVGAQWCIPSPSAARRTCQTRLTGTGLARVTRGQPVPAPDHTRTRDPHGFEGPVSFTSHRPTLPKRSQPIPRQKPHAHRQETSTRTSADPAGQHLSSALAHNFYTPQHYDF